jgi:hypothetical protein
MIKGANSRGGIQLFICFIFGEETSFLLGFALCFNFENTSPSISFR